MANTISTDLIVDSVSSTAQTVLSNRMAPLRFCAKDYSLDVRKPKDVVQVKLATAGSSTQINPTAFDSIGGSTLAASPVTLAHVYQPFGLEYADLQNGFKLADIVQVNVDKFADKLWEIATAPITVANFGAAAATAASASVTPSSGEIQKMWAATAKADRTALVLNTVSYANLIPTSTQGIDLLREGAYGFANGVFKASAFPSELKLAGFAIAPEALAMANAAPELSFAQGEFIVAERYTVEKLGLTVWYNLWFDPASRSYVGSLETMFGCNKAITNGTIGALYNP